MSRNPKLSVFICLSCNLCTISAISEKSRMLQGPKCSTVKELAIMYAFLETMLQRFGLKRFQNDSKRVEKSKNFNIFTFF